MTAAVAGVAGLRVADADGRVLVDGVDLELSAGTVTGLVGESGAGKTTLAQALLGHLGRGLRVEAGRVHVAGVDPFTATGRRTLRGRATAYLPQDPAAALDPARTVVAQLRTAARIAHPAQPRTARAALVSEAAAAAALEPELLHRRPAQLSGGQAQRALLAWTFVTRPRLLILDEPTSGLDPATALQASTAFATLPWQPAVLLISHDRDLIARASDRILHLAAGRLTSSTAAAMPTPTPTPTRPTPPLATPVLSMHAVTFRRGDRILLADASVHLGAGELLAIRGRSGSGKTTLARALCGLTRPQAGTLQVRGTELPWDAAARARAGGPFLAYVGQDARAALNPAEQGARTLARALDSARRAGRTVLTGPGELLERVGLDLDVLERTPDRLSGGQRHRLALARALAASPDVLVCDETTAALDPTTAARILDTLDTLRHDLGLPILLITHQDDVVARADRTLTLEEGRLV